MTTNKGMNPFVAGVIGVGVGVTVAVAAEELSKKENQEKIGEKFEEVKGKIEEFVSGAEEKVEDIKDDIKKKTD